MKILSGLVLSFATSFCFAQSPSWDLKEVKGQDNTIVGYIYHNYSIGTERTITSQRVVSGLRFVCSLKNARPIIGVFWDSSLGNNISGIQNPIWKVDGRIINTSPWMQEDKMMYGDVSENGELISAFKSGHVASVTWTAMGSVQRSTAFDLSNFTSHLPEFNTACKTAI